MAGTAHLVCTRCPSLLLSSTLRYATRGLHPLPSSSSLSPLLLRDGWRKVASTGPMIPRRELSVRAKASAVVEESSAEPVPSTSVPVFQKRLRIAEIKGGEDGGVARVGQTMTVRGWVRTCRLQKTFTFIEVSTSFFLC